MGPPPRAPLPAAVAPRRYTAADIERVARWVDLTRELTAAGLIRPNIGDIAEILVAWAVRGERGKLAARGWDVERDGEPRRIQVRGLWKPGHLHRGSLGRVPQVCDSIVGVEFGPDLTVIGAWEVTELPPAGTRISLGFVKRQGEPLDLNGADADLNLASSASVS